jgi:8-oxo-dGTP pyrophosphatase MutT (NUDIX family)
LTSPFRKVDEQSTYEGQFVHVAVATFEGPDGTFTREVVRHRGAVGVVALVDDGRSAVMVRQYRPTLERELLEIPAGMLDVEGESAAAAAARELEEEAGLRAVGDLELLSRYAVAPGLTDEWFEVYLARSVEPCEARPQSAEEEHMTVSTLRLDEVPALVADGTLEDAKSIIGLLLARERIGDA